MCECCEKGYPLKNNGDMGMNVSVRIGMRDGEYKLTAETKTVACFHSWCFPIGFCPMCGRDLRAGE